MHNFFCLVLKAKILTPLFFSYPTSNLSVSLVSSTFKIYTESDSLLPSYLLPDRYCTIIYCISLWKFPPNWSPLSAFTLLPSILNFVATVLLLKHKPDHIPPSVASHLIQSRSQSHHDSLPDPAWIVPSSLTFCTISYPCPCFLPFSHTGFFAILHSGKALPNQRHRCLMFLLTLSTWQKGSSSLGIYVDHSPFLLCFHSNVTFLERFLLSFIKYQPSLPPHNPLS